jgi:S-adenosylmethionine:tRNA ribosyltransferase-isomerase
MSSEQYSYDLPEELIARVPAIPRDSSRLFVCNTKTGEIHFDVFSSLPKYLSEQSLMVFNDTKVVPARTELFKETGGKAEILFLVNEWDKKSAVPVLSDRKLSAGQKLSRENFSFVVSEQKENVFMLKPQFPEERLEEFLRLYGTTPIPKYIGAHLSETELREKYQTIFAENPASVAAPTASLHFTKDIFDTLEKRGIEKTCISLHVGLGTFAPLREVNFKEHRLHAERFDISKRSAKVIAAAKQSGKSIVAVGTTTLRALESEAAEILCGEGGNGRTEIFIRPPYDFKIAEVLITNFHLPQSSLMMLVDAFLRYKKSSKSIVELYAIAVEKRFRFYSFGDAMLIL